MTPDRYFLGIIGLIKDFICAGFALLKRPLCVVVLILLFFGVLALNGVAPNEAGGFLYAKWRGFVDNRKEVFSEELASLSERVGAENNPLLAHVLPKSSPASKKAAEKPEEKPAEPLFVKASVAPVREVETVSNDGAVSGALVITGADMVRIGGRDFILKARLRTGKARDAFMHLKERFDKAQAKCYPDAIDAGYAQCFVGSIDLAEMLIDYGYATAP